MRGSRKTSCNSQQQNSQYHCLNLKNACPMPNQCYYNCPIFKCRCLCNYHCPIFSTYLCTYLCTYVNTIVLSKHHSKYDFQHHSEYHCLNFKECHYDCPIFNTVNISVQFSPTNINIEILLSKLKYL